MMIFFFFFFFGFGFYCPFKKISLISSRSFIKGGKNRRTRGKNIWPAVSRTWLSHMWPEQGSNHSGEKPNGLRVSSLIHQATGARWWFGVVYPSLYYFSPIKKTGDNERLCTMKCCTVMSWILLPERFKPRTSCSKAGSQPTRPSGLTINKIFQNAVCWGCE